MTRARPLRIAVAIFSSTLVASCAVGPNFHQPLAPANASYTPTPVISTRAPVSLIAGGAQSFSADTAIEKNWWTLFHSPELNALIAQALKANSDLAFARAALKVAQENYKAQRGILYPQVDASANSSRNKSSQYLSPVLNQTVFDYSLQTAQVNVGYTLDLFGGNRRTIEAAKAEAESQRFQTEAAQITLASNVAAAAFQEASLRGQVVAQQRVIALEEDTLRIAQHQLAKGQIAGADVLTQEAALAQARVALPPLQKALALQQDLLAYLTGRTPGEGAVKGIDLATLTLPQHLPLSLPSQLVRQRPDIRAAEEILHAESAEVGVAIANRFPNITLNASAGGASSGWSSLLSALNSFWSIGAGITQPIFQGGALLHKQRAAKAAYEQADAQYRSTVLAAFQNVADTLHALQSDADELDAAQASQKSAEASFKVTQYQYSKGQVPFLNVLSAEQTLRQAEAVLVQAQTARFADTAALYQALGGGWW